MPEDNNKETFLSKEQIKLALLGIKEEVKEENTEFSKGWRNGLARLFWELKL